MCPFLIQNSYLNLSLYLPKWREAQHCLQFYRRSQDLTVLEHVLPSYLHWLPLKYLLFMSTWFTSKQNWAPHSFIKALEKLIHAFQVSCEKLTWAHYLPSYFFLPSLFQRKRVGTPLLVGVPSGPWQGSEIRGSFLIYVILLHVSAQENRKNR